MSIETIIAASAFRSGIAGQTDLPEDSLAPAEYIQAAEERAVELNKILNEELIGLLDMIRYLIDIEKKIKEGTLTIKDCIDVKTFAFECVFPPDE